MAGSGMTKKKMKRQSKELIKYCKAKNYEKIEVISEIGVEVNDQKKAWQITALLKRIQYNIQHESTNLYQFYIEFKREAQY